MYVDVLTIAREESKIPQITLCLLLSILKYLILRKISGKFLIPLVNTLYIHPCFIVLNFSLSNVHMCIGELCKRNNTKKRGEAVLLSQYGTISHYSECIVILIWPMIQQCIKNAVMFRT